MGFKISLELVSVTVYLRPENEVPIFVYYTR